MQDSRITTSWLETPEVVHSKRALSSVPVGRFVEHRRASYRTAKEILTLRSLYPQYTVAYRSDSSFYIQNSRSFSLVGVR